MRSAVEVKARCKIILGDQKIVKLIEQSGSPTAAYTVVLVETKDEEFAKAARWLAVLRRDYLKEYNKLISSIIIPNHAIEARSERSES